MIKFENTEIMNFECAIRGMRNPMNSWEKSDSHFCDEDCPHVMNGTEPALECNNGVYDFCIGKNDFALMKNLVKAGSDHRKFLRQILVSVDITAPLYWWKEFDTYKVGTVSNSCSTMHKIHEKEFTIQDFSYEHLEWRDEMFEYGDILPLRNLENTVMCLNQCRKKYLETKNKMWWWQMIQLLPSSYNQRRTVTMNYEVLRNIAESRKKHKLDEWRVGFMGWIKSLPYAVDLILDGGEEK